MLNRRLAPGSALGRPLIFLHIPKTAGTSVSAALRGRWTDDEVMPQLQANFHGNHPIWLVMTQRYRLLGLGMHLDHERAMALRAGCLAGGHVPLLLTLLREPVARLESRYREWRSTPDESFSHARRHVQDAIRMAKTRSFQDFLLSDNPVIVNGCDNLQARLLAGLNRSRVLSHAGILEEALDSLRQYDVIGSTPTCDDTLGVLQQAYQWAPDSTPTPRLHISDALEPELLAVTDSRARERLCNYTELDKALWEYLLSADPEPRMAEVYAKPEPLEEVLTILTSPAHDDAATESTDASVGPLTSSPPRTRCLVDPAALSGKAHHGLTTLRRLASDYRPRRIIGLGKRAWPALIGYRHDACGDTADTLWVLRSHALSHQRSRLLASLATPEAGRLAITEVPDRDFRIQALAKLPTLTSFVFSHGSGSDHVLTVDLAGLLNSRGRKIAIGVIDAVARCHDTHPDAIAALEESEPNHRLLQALLIPLLAMLHGCLEDPESAADPVHAVKALQLNAQVASQYIGMPGALPDMTFEESQVLYRESFDWLADSWREAQQP